MRVAVVVEVSVPSGTDVTEIRVASLRLDLPDCAEFLPMIRRVEIHPDPSAVFPDEVDSGT